VEVATERRQGDVDDRRVEDRHDGSEHDDRRQGEDLGCEDALALISLRLHPFGRGLVHRLDAGHPAPLCFWLQKLIAIQIFVPQEYLVRSRS
jgi:hypothetical protein